VNEKLGLFISTDSMRPSAVGQPAALFQDKAVVVHYNPGKPTSSAMLESDIAALLQNRPPSPVPDIPPANSVPDWISPFLWFFVCFSAVGLIVSLWVHLGAVMGRRVAPEAFFWIARWNLRCLVSSSVCCATARG
jgi:hypothetical protein